MAGTVAELPIRDARMVEGNVRVLACQGHVTNTLGNSSCSVLLLLCVALWCVPLFCSVWLFFMIRALFVFAVVCCVCTAVPCCILRSCSHVVCSELCLSPLLCLTLPCHFLFYICYTCSALPVAWLHYSALFFVLRLIRCASRSPVSVAVLCSALLSALLC